MGTHGSFHQIPALTIPSGASVSNVIPSPTFVDCPGILLYGPPALDALTYRIQVHPDPRATNSTLHWRNLADLAGTDFSPPAALKAQMYTDLASAGAIRIQASGNVTADRTWSVTGVMTL
jgi:hypothetical protein